MQKGGSKLPAHIQFETVSPATKLLEKRRKMYEIHQSFQTQKEEFKKQEEQFKKIEEDIRRRDLQIQVDLISYCQFIQDNETKKKKAGQRLEQENKACEEKEREKNNFENQEKELKRHKERFEKKNASLRKYEQYLEKVKNTYPDQFPDIQQILNRYNTLKRTNDELTAQRIATENEFEKLKQEVNTTEKQLNQQILQLNNEIKESSKRLEERINERNQLQSSVQSSNNNSSAMNLNLGRIIMAIDNLYTKCSEFNLKIRHDFTEYMEKKSEGKSKQKKVEEKKKEKKQDEKNRDEDFEEEFKKAIAKLKAIVDYMNDYKRIIEDFENPKKKR